MNFSSRIAIIGAGMAGLSCAGALQEAGYQVTLFEKSRGPSGRMSTRSSASWQCDHGAQYFTARSPEFRAEVSRWEAAGVAAIWSPRLQVLAGEHAHQRDAEILRFVGLPKMTAPGRWLAAPLTIEPGHSVKQIRRSAEGWQLETVEAGWLATQFDSVLLAVPAPQAAPLLAPVAPEMAALASGARMRGCWALMLQFAAPLALPFDAAFVNQGRLRWIARDNSKPGRQGPETWLLHATAEWSEARLEDNAKDVEAELVDAFRQACTPIDIPLPQDSSAHRWRYADSFPALTQGCAWEKALGLGMCGDWLNGGKVEGAWLSGRQLAARLMPS